MRRKGRHHRCFFCDYVRKKGSQTNPAGQGGPVGSHTKL